MGEAGTFDLERFVAAQASVYPTALGELQAGRKQTHWMWFIFPQVRGLGHSPMAMRFAIHSLAEARAYMAHPLLGRRLEICTQAALAVEARTLDEIFGTPDDMKFRSCMTLFARAAGDEASVFQTALDRLCGGHADERTLALLLDDAT